MKAFLLSFVFLFLTLPFLGSTPYYGIPLWVYGSLFFSILYALTLIFVLEKKWGDFIQTDE